MKNKSNIKQSEAIKLFKKFEDEYLTRQIAGDNFSIRLYGDFLYRIRKADEFILDKGLKILRAELKLGQIKNGRFEPSYALAHYISKLDAVFTYELNYEDGLKYLEGQTLSVNLPDAWVLVCYDSLPLSFSKAVKGVLKNFHPKGLRKTNLYSGFNG